jgi:TPR repeat protein
MHKFTISGAVRATINKLAENIPVFAFVAFLSFAGNTAFNALASPALASPPATTPLPIATSPATQQASSRAPHQKEGGQAANAVPSKKEQTPSSQSNRTPPDIADLTRRANAGDANAQFELGRCYNRGDGCERNLVESTKWFLKAAEQGNLNAQLFVSFAYLDAVGVEKNMEKSIYWLRKAAEQGDCHAQFVLGSYYVTGAEIPKDTKEAAKWFSKAAGQGDAEAQFHLGVLYVTGDGVQRDVAEGIRLYRCAAEQGNMKAQRYLAYHYANGAGITKDSKEAVKWFIKAAEQGDDLSQFTLGIHYATGAGVEKNMNEAIKWFRKAANQGHSDAQSCLVACYGGNFGVQRNIMEGLKWRWKMKPYINKLESEDNKFLKRFGKGANGIFMKGLIEFAKEGKANAQIMVITKYYFGDEPFDIKPDRMKAMNYLAEALWGKDNFFALEFLEFLVKEGNPSVLDATSIETKNFLKQVLPFFLWAIGENMLIRAIYARRHRHN